MPSIASDVTVCAIEMTGSPDLDTYSGSDYFPTVKFYSGASVADGTLLGTFGGEDARVDDEQEPEFHLCYRQEMIAPPVMLGFAIISVHEYDLSDDPDDRFELIAPQLNFTANYSTQSYSGSSTYVCPASACDEESTFFYNWSVALLHPAPPPTSPPPPSTPGSGTVHLSEHDCTIGKWVSPTGDPAGYPSDGADCLPFVRADSQCLGDYYVHARGGDGNCGCAISTTTDCSSASAPDVSVDADRDIYLVLSTAGTGDTTGSLVLSGHDCNPKKWLNQYPSDPVDCVPYVRADSDCVGEYYVHVPATYGGITYGGDNNCGCIISNDPYVVCSRSSSSDTQASADVGYYSNIYWILPT